MRSQAVDQADLQGLAGFMREMVPLARSTNAANSFDLVHTFLLNAMAVPS